LATTTLRTVASATMFHDTLILIREILRNGVTDPESRGTSATQEFNGDGDETEFTVTNGNVLNVSTVAIGASTKTMGIDYQVEYANKKVIFTTAPAVGVNNVDITYRYSSTNQSLVYTSFPKADIVYPVIVLSHSGQRDDWQSIGADYKEVMMNITIDVFSTSSKELDELWDDVYDTLASQQATLEKNGIEDLVVTRAVNIEAEASKRTGGLHRKSAEIQVRHYYT